MHGVSPGGAGEWHFFYIRLSFPPCLGESVSPPCHKTLKVSRTLLLLSLWGRGLPEEEFRGAESTPEFLIFNDEVIGCEILDWSGRRWAVLRSTTGALGSLLKRRRAHRGPSAALWNLPGFYNGLYFATVPKESPSPISPSGPCISHSFYLPMCVGFSVFPQVFTRLLDALLPPKMLAAVKWSPTTEV